MKGVEKLQTEIEGASKRLSYLLAAGRLPPCEPAKRLATLLSEAVDVTRSLRDYEIREVHIAQVQRSPR